MSQINVRPGSMMTGSLTGSVISMMRQETESQQKSAGRPAARQTGIANIITT